MCFAVYRQVSVPLASFLVDVRNQDGGALFSKEFCNAFAVTLETHFSGHVLAQGSNTYRCRPL